MLLGGTAVWKMSSVKTIANMLAAEYMPATLAANEVERDSLNTMYEMRGYAFTEDTNMLAKAESNLAEVKQDLQVAKDLASKPGHQNLGFLKTAAEKAEAKALDYEELAKKTVAVTEALEKDRANMNVAAQDYMKVCDSYLADQEARLQAALKATNAAGGIDMAGVEERISKLTQAYEIVDLGNGIRIGNFKAQAARDPELFRATQKKFTEVNQKLDALKAVTRLEVNLKQIAECRAAGQAYNDAMTSFLSNWLTREDLAKKRGVAGAAVLAEARNTALGCLEASSKGSTNATNSLTGASTTLIVGLCLAAIFGVTLALLMTRGITKVLTSISSALGDGSNQVVSAAGQVSSSSQSLAEGASEQAASLEETSSSLEELSSMTQRNSGNAQQVNDLAKQSRSAADKGVADMQSMNAAMEAIKVSSDDIAKIIKTIDEIAFQTNILALNAAVEAARAGEAGMGFAVVADEVRNLAQRSAQAAKETAAKIEGAIAKTGQGVEISRKVGEALNEIVTKARQVDELAAEVATASREQTNGITQINLAVSQMDKVTQSNAANAEESAAAAEELNAQAAVMQQAVSELLEMVGGIRESHHHTTSKPTHLARTVRTHSPAPAKKVASDRASKTNGYHPAPALTASGSKRDEIPMDGDFKDF